MKKIASIFISIIMVTSLYTSIQTNAVKCYTERAVDKHPKIW